MNRIFKFKLIVITIFLGVSIVFYEKLFSMSTQTIYHYNITLVFVVALCFGIIFAIALYNLSIFMYIRDKQHLYYALAQFSVLLFLANLDSLYIAPFDEIFKLKTLMLFGVSQLLILIFSLLFLNEFFKAYEIRQLKIVIQSILYIALFDMLLTLVFSHNVVTKFLPIFIFIWLVLSEANRLVSRRDVAFNLIMVGWYVVLLVVLFEYMGFINFTGIIFPFLHIAFSLESIFLSIAISYKFKLLEKENQLQQTLLYQKARMANIGEMVSMIAHQWRQPLHYISFGLMNLKSGLQNNEKGLDILKKLHEQLKYMSNTIEDFRNFYNPSKAKITFSLYESSQCSAKIVKNALDIAEIVLQIDVKEDCTLYGNQNELEQVVLNLINNAKDAHIERKTVQPYIKIIIQKEMMTIQDNAGGIKDKHIHKIFEPYFTTKENSDGIGLYLSKKIVEEEFGGYITVASNTIGTTLRLMFFNKPQKKSLL